MTYENFITANMEVVEKCIPHKTRAKCRVPWELLIVRKYILTK